MLISPFVAALVFFINTIFGIYIFLVMLRFILQWQQVGFRGDPIVGLLWKTTDPPLKLLYNFIPGWHGIDFAAIVLMFGLKVLEVTSIAWLYGQHISAFGLFLVSIASLLSLTIYIFIFAILIQAILSWIAPQTSYNNPLANILYYLTEPLLRSVRGKIPPLQGLDLSPLVVVIALQLAEILLVGFLQQLAR